MTTAAAARGIRWDRLGRVALLGTLLMILFAYASPARQWIKQSGTAGHQKQQLSELNRENRDLKRRVRVPARPGCARARGAPARDGPRRRALLRDREPALAEAERPG